MCNQVPTRESCSMWDFMYTMGIHHDKTHIHHRLGLVSQLTTYKPVMGWVQGKVGLVQVYPDLYHTQPIVVANGI